MCLCILVDGEALHLSFLHYNKVKLATGGTDLLEQ